MKPKPKNVLSLFGGIECGYLALKAANIPIGKYYSSEIEPEPIMIVTHRAPSVIHVGDVRNLKGENFKHIDIVIAGSPCQALSIAGKKIGFSNENTQSYLFFEFLRLYREIKMYNPNVLFLLENVRMNEKWEKLISDELGVLPMLINSDLLTAQHRERLYWTNIPGVTIPEDKHIQLSDVIPGAQGYGVRGTHKGKYKPDGKKVWERNCTTRKNGKANCVMTKPHNTNKLIFPDGTIRNYTINEAELLQGLPIDYTNVPGISMTKRYKAVGNGWTVPVIAHILKFLKK
jgi:DNA (cytosine-5)-methyltransferase 3A